ncbi:methyltransferase [Streptomyces sp. 796.1]|uniref:methyltransferase n=1 Tax=Streptomyces sp. 796.1 TaxID=3163029 RepID=UPI0039C9F1E9
MDRPGGSPTGVPSGAEGAQPSDPDPAQAPDPGPLLDLLDGFRRTKVLTTAVRLHLFDLLAERGPLRADEVAAALDLRERPATLLLTACAALDLLAGNADEGYRNSPAAQAFLVSTGAAYLGGYIDLVEEQHYPGWGELLTSVRDDRPATWDAAGQEEAFADQDGAGQGPGGRIELFWKAMASASAAIAGAVAASYDFAPHRRLLDVGGGPSDLSVRLCRQVPGLHATVYDLPQVVALTERRMVDLGLADRVRTVGGDLLGDAPLPGGHDLVVLSNVLHMWDRETNEAVLRKCHAALDQGGTLVIAEAFVDDDGSGPRGAALMSLHMLVNTAGGRNYSRAAYEAMLTRAGFARTARLPVASEVAAGVNGLLVAHK